MAGVRRGEREWRTSLFHTSTFTRNLVCSRNGLQYVITDSFHPLNRYGCTRTTSTPSFASSPLRPRLIVEHAHRCERRQLAAALAVDAPLFPRVGNEGVQGPRHGLADGHVAVCRRIDAAGIHASLAENAFVQPLHAVLWGERGAELCRQTNDVNPSGLMPQKTFRATY